MCVAAQQGDFASKPTCCIIGSGNVASHLACALQNRLQILQVLSRDINHARELADIVGAQSISNVSELRADADIYLISITDDNIGKLLDATSHITGGIWIHTSGSISIDIFNRSQCLKAKYGILYPLQTFSKHKDIDIATVPFFIEGSDALTESKIGQLVEMMGAKARHLDSAGRCRIHIAAVFACNFVNAMWVEAAELLSHDNLDINILSPLLKETLDKISQMSPQQAQTGPASRGDIGVIERHMSMLQGDQAHIYQILSQRIMDLSTNK